jgi:cobalamin biosynthesis Mg chelatase CobN
MRTTTTSIPRTQPPTNQGYSASVPLSVYRELAAELQAMQATMNSLSSQNQNLTQENQLLRQEITKAVQSIMQLQKLTDPSASYNPELYTPANFNREINQINQPVTEPRPEANRTRNFSNNAPQQQKASRPRKSSNSSAPKKQFRPEPTPEYFPVSEPVYFEQQEIRYYPSRKKEPDETNGWVLIIAIVLIIVTAFGAGYLVVRPLLQHRSN